MDPQTFSATSSQLVVRLGSVLMLFKDARFESTISLVLMLFKDARFESTISLL
jgi:hypothetical protein